MIQATPSNYAGSAGSSAQLLELAKGTNFKNSLCTADDNSRDLLKKTLQKIVASDEYSTDVYAGWVTSFTDMLEQFQLTHAVHDFPHAQ